MASYLLLWNSDNSKYPWDELPEMAAAVKRGEVVPDGWIVRSVKKYAPGDRVYILKVGGNVCGIMGSGTISRDIPKSSGWPRQVKRRVSFHL